MHVVLEVGDRRIIARTKRSIDRRRNDHMLLVVFQSVIMATSKITLKNEKCSRHIVVTMGYYRTIFVEGEHLMAEY